MCHFEVKKFSENTIKLNWCTGGTSKPKEIKFSLGILADCTAALLVRMENDVVIFTTTSKLTDFQIKRITSKVDPQIVDSFDFIVGYHPRTPYGNTHSFMIFAAGKMSFGWKVTGSCKSSIKLNPNRLLTFGKKHESPHLLFDFKRVESQIKDFISTHNDKMRLSE